MSWNRNLPSKGCATVEWAPFRYGEYWDYPRVLLVEFDGALHLLDSPFDEVADDYPQTYTIKVLTATPASDTWLGLGDEVYPVGSLPITTALFDATRRRQIRVDLVRAAIQQGPRGS